MIPRQFEFEEYSIGLLGGSFSVHLDENRLIVSKSSDPFTAAMIYEVQIPPDRWLEFLDALDAIDVWKWQTEYSNPGITDGRGWRLKVAVGKHCVDSKGENAYPGKPDQFFRSIPVNWPQYNALRAALLELIGDQEA